MADEIISKYSIDTKEGVASVNALNAQLNTSDKALKNLTKSAQTLSKSGFSPLSNSIAQFSRELPNAAISAQTFFISISNQIGGLQDAIKGLIEQNKVLAAQGLKTQSVFKLVAQSIFSFTTLLNLGVTVLVLYGKEIGNFLTSLFKGAEGLDKARNRFNAFNEALASKDVKNAIVNINTLRTNIDLAQRGLLDKKTVLEQYNSTFGKTAGAARSLDEAEKELVKSGPAFIAMTIAKAAAQVAAEKAAELSVEQRQKLLERERSIAKEIIELNKREQDEIARFRARGGDSEDLQTEFSIRQRFARLRRQLTDETLNSEIIALEQNINDQLKIATEFQEKAAKIARENELNFFGDGDSFNKAISDLPSLDNLNITATLPVNFEPQLKGFEQVEKGAKAAALTDLELLKELIKSRENGETQYTAFLEAELKLRLKKRQEADDQEIELEKIKREKLNELLNQFVAGAFETASANAQALADEDIRILEEKKEKELENEKLTREQRAAIEKTFDEQRAQILNKNAKTQRDLDLAQIVVTTALAVIRQFATGDPFSAALRANLAAAEGALQFAIAAAQPLPKFNKGTDRVRGGIPGRDSVLAALTPDEAVIPAQENMKYPGMSKAWVSGQLDQFLAMKYLGPALEEMNKKNVITINNDNSKLTSSSFSDKKLVRTMEESNLINKMIYREIKKTGGFGGRSNRKLWN